MATEYDNLDFEELKSGAPDAFKKPKEMSIGDEIMGVYLGSFFQLGTADKVFDKPQKVHRIFTPDGQVVGVNGVGDINKHLTDNAKGKFVKIIYEGKSVIEKGEWAGKDAHNFKVTVALKDNPATLALKKRAAEVPDYIPPALPPAMALTSDGSLGAAPNLIGAGPDFSNEQAPLV